MIDPDRCHYCMCADYCHGPHPGCGVEDDPFEPVNPFPEEEEG